MTSDPWLSSSCICQRLCPLGKVSALVADQGPGGPLATDGAQPRPWVVSSGRSSLGARLLPTLQGGGYPRGPFPERPLTLPPHRTWLVALKGAACRGGALRRGGGALTRHPLGDWVRSRDRGAGGRGQLGPSRAGRPGSFTVPAGLNPKPRKESVLSFLWVSGRRGGEHGARGQPSGIGRGRGARTGRAGWCGRRRTWEGCGVPRGPGSHGGWAGLSFAPRSVPRGRAAQYRAGLSLVGPSGLLRNRSGPVSFCGSSAGVRRASGRAGQAA